MTRLGIAFSGGPCPAEIVHCIKVAEHLGYEAAWVAEGHGGDQFATLAAAAAQTSRIALGTGITSVFVRSIPTIAMAAATVCLAADSSSASGPATRFRSRPSTALSM